MKRIFLTIITVLLLTACGQEVKPEDISKINGYWEIEKVILPNGEKKEYKVNETIDYFHVANKAGFRKKVMPQLDGKYLETGTSEKIETATVDGKTVINYDSGYAKWQEEIIELTSEKLVLKNEAKLEYHYKKPIPFTVK